MEKPKLIINLKTYPEGTGKAASPPGPPQPITMNISDCKIMMTACNEAAGFQAFGWVSAEGHFTEDNTTDFPYALCCKNLANKGSGVVSFKYSNGASSQIEQGHISINSTKTLFQEKIYMGFGKHCIIKNDCNLSNSEICLFKVCDSYPTCKLNATNPYTIDNTHIADCNTPNTPLENNYTKKLCCEFDEICTDGKDNDGDNYIDCADEDCKTTESNTVPPAICTNSPYNAETCVINHTTLPNGTIVVLYNQTCIGQTPFPAFPQTYPVLNPPAYQNSEGWSAPVWYCSYGETENANAGNPGICCQSGTYAKWNSVINQWTCADSEACGLDPTDFPCEYDYDLDNPSWMASTYYGNNNDWCQSKFPYYFTPDIIPFAPRRSTGCCLIEYHGDVDYYTAENNVKIFGYQSYCGDGIIDAGEQCDNNYLGTCENQGTNCPTGFILTGTPGCINCTINATMPYCNCALPTTGTTGTYTD